VPAPTSPPAFPGEEFGQQDEQQRQRQRGDAEQNMGLEGRDAQICDDEREKGDHRCGNGETSSHARRGRGRAPGCRNSQTAYRHGNQGNRPDIGFDIGGHEGVAHFIAADQAGIAHQRQIDCRGGGQHDEGSSARGRRQRRPDPGGCRDKHGNGQSGSQGRVVRIGDTMFGKDERDDHECEDRRPVPGQVSRRRRTFGFSQPKVATKIAVRPTSRKAPAAGATGSSTAGEEERPRRPADDTGNREPEPVAKARHGHDRCGDDEGMGGQRQRIRLLRGDEQRRAIGAKQPDCGQFRAVDGGKQEAGDTDDRQADEGDGRSDKSVERVGGVERAEGADGARSRHDPRNVRFPEHRQIELPVAPAQPFTRHKQRRREQRAGGDTRARTKQAGLDRVTDQEQRSQRNRDTAQDDRPAGAKQPFYVGCAPARYSNLRKRRRRRRSGERGAGERDGLGFGHRFPGFFRFRFRPGSGCKRWRHIWAPRPFRLLFGGPCIDSGPAQRRTQFIQFVPETAVLDIDAAKPHQQHKQANQDYCSHVRPRLFRSVRCPNNTLKVHSKMPQS
jgi:hypothetical protein